MFKMPACTLGIGVVPRKMKRRSAKSLQLTSLCYSNARFTLKVPLNFTNDEKAKHEYFDFTCLLSFFFLLPQA